MKVIIDDFKLKCHELKEKYKEDIVYNKILSKVDDFSKIKYIIVGDNPGKEELRENKYLTGSAGKRARRIFKNKFNIINFDEELIILNKTPIYTSKTKLLNKKNEDLLKESQEYMVNMIFNLIQKLNIPVIIVGFGGCRQKGKWLSESSRNKKSVCKYFFNELKIKLKEKRELIFFTKHFSYGHFGKDLNKNDDIKDITERLKKISDNYSNGFW